MEREIDDLLAVYTITEIFEMFDLNEKEILLYLVEEGILELDMETLINNGVQISTGSI